MDMQHSSWNKTLNEIFYSKTKVSKIQQQKLQNNKKCIKNTTKMIKTIIEVYMLFIHKILKMTIFLFFFLLIMACKSVFPRMTITIEITNEITSN